jgi:hypothetical protein
MFLLLVHLTYLRLFVKRTVPIASSIICSFHGSLLRQNIHKCFVSASKEVKNSSSARRASGKKYRNKKEKKKTDYELPSSKER